MDVRQFRHFAAVAETLHFGRAAARLGITQPPLSQSILALERDLGGPLFERTRRSVALTPLGAQWLPHVQAALAALDALPATADKILKGQSGQLSLSFVSTADYSVLPTLVHSFRQRYPEVELVLTEATSEKQIDMLLHGGCQLGLIIPPSDDSLHPGFAYRRLLREPLIAAVPEAWVTEGRLPEATLLRPEDVITSPLIVFPRPAAPAFHDLITQYYQACGGTADVVQNAIQMQTIISLVSAGMGIALVPQSLRHLARPGVRYLELGGRVPMLETGVIWQRDDPTPTLRNFLEVAGAMTEEGEA